MSAAIAAPSSSGRVPPSETTGETTSTSSPTSARNGYPRAPPPRGQQASCADSVRSSAPPIWSAARGHGSAPSYGIATVPSDCAPLTTPSISSPQLRGLRYSRSIPDTTSAANRPAAVAAGSASVYQRGGTRSQAMTSAAAAVAAATHSRARPELSPATIRCHSSAPSEASAANPSSRAAHSGSSASGPRSDVVTAPIPSPSGAARCAGSCRSASSAARRRTRCDEGRHRRTGVRGRTSGSPPPARRSPRGPWPAR